MENIDIRSDEARNSGELEHDSGLQRSHHKKFHFPTHCVLSLAAVAPPMLLQRG